MAAAKKRRTTRKRRVKGPGLTKARRQRLIERRSVEFYRSTDYRWRELFESADVISEGATRSEADGSVYYGSTSILLLLRSRGGSIDDDEVNDVNRLLGSDPHARVRAVRIACLEAQLRSGGPIGRVRAELFVRQDQDGIRVDVEVEAQVFEDAAGTARANRGPAGASRVRKGKA